MSGGNGIFRRAIRSARGALLARLGRGGGGEPPVGPVARYRDAEPWIPPPAGMSPEEIAACVDRDTAPLPATADREGYHADRHYDYWLSGLTDWRTIHGALERHGTPLADGDGVLEFGCASGRVLRHFLAQPPEVDLWACDINGAHVDWVRRHLADARVKAFVNAPEPPLPIPDEALALVFAFSVFTHIDEAELAWLAELRRVLRPGGVAFLTVHTDHTWSHLKPDWALWDALIDRDVVDREVTPELFSRPMPSEREVFRWKRRGTYSKNVFHHTDYLREVWGEVFELAEVRREAAGYQDAVVLVRR